MLDAFWAGALAGYGIAIPVGAIAVLIVELGLERGFGSAFAAGAGTATADLIYATIAAVAGVALASLSWQSILASVGARWAGVVCRLRRGSSQASSAI